MKFIAHLLPALFILATPLRSTAQDDAVILHCRYHDNKGMEGTKIIKINKSSGAWLVWDDKNQQFRGWCPIESTTQICKASSSRFDFRFESLDRNGEGQIIQTTVWRDDGRYESTKEEVLPAADLRSLGLPIGPQVIESGTCEPGKAPTPRPAKF